MDVRKVVGYVANVLFCVSCHLEPSWFRTAPPRQCGGALIARKLILFAATSSLFAENRVRLGDQPVFVPEFTQSARNQV
jgi:hypothetical protein